MPTGTSYSYTAVGNLEHFNDVLTDISPTATPIYSMIGKGQAFATTEDWLTDSLREGQENAHMEDADLLSVIAPARKRLSNNVQIFQVGYYVTDTQQKVIKAAVDDEMGLQMQKATKELARDIEYRIVTGDDRYKMDATLPGLMGGVPYFNDVNVVDGGDAVYGGNTFNEVMLLDALEKAEEQGGEPNVAFMSIQNKRLASGFTAEGQKNYNQETRRLERVIDVYQTDFGDIKFVPNRFYKVGKFLEADEGRIDLLQTEMWQSLYLIDFHDEELPRTRLTRDRNINGSMTIRCDTKDAHACIKGLDR